MKLYNSDPCLKICVFSRNDWARGKEVVKYQETDECIDGFCVHVAFLENNKKYRIPPALPVELL